MSLCTYSNTSQNPSVFLYGPGNAKIEEHPIPKLDDPHDVVVRIAYTGVCGSDVSIHSHSYAPATASNMPTKCRYIFGATVASEPKSQNRILS